MQIGQFMLKFYQRMVGARNVARTTSARPHLAGRFTQRFNDVLILAHAQVVVGAPHRDFPRRCAGTVNSPWKLADDTLQIAKTR